MGANVIITEVDPLPGLRAVMDGFRVMKMDEAASIGDIFCTATGMKDILVGRHFDSMKDGAIISNTGHYDCEINIEQLKSQAVSMRNIRPENDEYTMADGRRIFLLADGRLVNLAAAEGHPSEVMDMSFANQFLSLCRLAADGAGMAPIVHDISFEQDQDLAMTKLATLGFGIDELTAEQTAYLTDYTAGT
jgi:adenosylhomocysteinase